MKCRCRFPSHESTAETHSDIPLCPFTPRVGTVRPSSSGAADHRREWLTLGQEVLSQQSWGKIRNAGAQVC